MTKQFIKGLVTKIGENKYRVIASTDAIDRQGDSIDQSGWKLENYMKNPVMLWAHDYSQLPVARAISVTPSEKQMIVDFEFAPPEASPMASFVKNSYDSGFVNATSVGFIPLKRNGNVITEAELLEISFVPVPANQEALRLTYKALEDDLKLTDDQKKTLKAQFEKGEVADELNAEEMAEAKYENLDEMFEIVYAMCNVYCDPATPVEDFGKLLGETVTLLQELATNGSDDEGEKTLKYKDISRLTISDLTKSGRKLSAETMKALDNIHKCIKDADTAMEGLKASATDGDGSGDDGKSAKRSVEKGSLVIDAEKAEQLRKAFQISDKQHEFILGMLKALNLQATVV